MMNNSVVKGGRGWVGVAAWVGIGHGHVCEG